MGSLGNQEELKEPEVIKSMLILFNDPRWTGQLTPHCRCCLRGERVTRLTHRNPSVPPIPQLELWVEIVASPQKKNCPIGFQTHSKKSTRFAHSAWCSGRHSRSYPLSKWRGRIVVSELLPPKGENGFLEQWFSTPAANWCDWGALKHSDT